MKGINEKKMSIYDKLQLLSENNSLDDFWFIIKTNFFHSFFNALLSTWTITTIVCLIPNVGIKFCKLSDFIFNTLLTPGLIITAFIILESLIVFLMTLDKSTKVLKNPNGFKQTYIQQYFKLICGIGVVTYILAASITLLICDKFIFKDQIKNVWWFYCTGLSFSLAFGIIWNYSSYYRLRRMDCAKIFRINSAPSKKEQFKVFSKQLVSEVLGSIITSISAVVYYYIVKITQENSSYYTIFYVIYFTLLCTYMRQIYLWEFSLSASNQTVYKTKDLF